MILNTLILRDNVYCPDGQGEVIRNFIVDLFDRTAKRIVELNPSPLDLLVISSSSLSGCVFGSLNLFEKQLDDALSQVGRRERCIPSFGFDFGGAVSERNLVERAQRVFKVQDVQLKYVFPEYGLSTENTGYFLRNVDESGIVQKP